MLTAKDSVSNVTAANVVMSQTERVAGAERAKDNNKSSSSSKPSASASAKQVLIKSQPQKQRII